MFMENRFPLRNEAKQTSRFGYSNEQSFGRLKLRHESGVGQGGRGRCAFTPRSNVLSKWCVEYSVALGGFEGGGSTWNCRGIE